MAVRKTQRKLDRTRHEDVTSSRFESARLLAIVLTATLFSVMNSTMVNVAIPSFMRDFHVGLASSVWLYTGYVLPFAICTPLFGVLGERVGAKRVFLAGAGGFLVTSLLCSAAWSLGALLVFRVFQAIAAGAVVSNALVLVTAGFPGHQRGLVLGIWSAVSGVAVSIGLTLAGWLVEYQSWRAIFWINAPFLFAVVVFGSRSLRELPKGPKDRHFDVGGALLLTLGVGALILGLSTGQTAGWKSNSTLTLLVLSPIGIGAFVWWEQTVEDPLMPLALIKRPAYALAMVTMFMQSMVFFAIFLLLPLYLQDLRGRSPFETGIMTLPLSLAVMLVGPLAGRISTRTGPRLPASAGIVLLAIGSIGFARLTLSSGYPALAWALVVSGIGLGASISPLTSTAMGAATPSERGAASGFFNMVRFVGAVIGTSVLSTVLATRTADGTTRGIALPAATQAAFHDVFLVAAALAVVGAATALFMQPAPD